MNTMFKKIITILFAGLFLVAPFAQVQAASVSFYTSGGGTLYLGNQFNVSVYANGSDAYNAVTVNVSYSNLTFVGASAASGWTGVSGPSNSGSTVSFSGALLGSSATGSKNVLNLTFRALNYASTGTISASGTIALADGSGTKVNGGGNTVTYSVVNPPAPPPTAPGNPSVTSTSHPSQDDWYNKTTVDLSWNKADGVDGFSYELDQKTDTNPDDTSEGTDTSKSYSEFKRW